MNRKVYTSVCAAWYWNRPYTYSKDRSTNNRQITSNTYGLWSMYIGCTRCSEAYNMLIQHTPVSIPSPANPSCLQATAASFSPQVSPHTGVHMESSQYCTSPSEVVDPLNKRITPACSPHSARGHSNIICDPLREWNWSMKPGSTSIPWYKPKLTLYCNTQISICENDKLAS